VVSNRTKSLWMLSEAFRECRTKRLSRRSTCIDFEDCPFHTWSLRAEADSFHAAEGRDLCRDDSVDADNSVLERFRDAPNAPCLARRSKPPTRIPCHSEGHRLCFRLEAEERRDWPKVSSRAMAFACDASEKVGSKSAAECVAMPR